MSISPSVNHLLVRSKALQGLIALFHVKPWEHYSSDSSAMLYCARRRRDNNSRTSTCFT